ncbi:TRAP transporter substrate-binding protein [Humibacillus xanthopallidus]|uniref:TRAP-type C4-dicarboxylate transport system substrate-binding protein n=1 Tax=Humibacillus xanthopallidus TaxID=412689 RepID=A0A543I399_9MICO|nr:TRAP transporter substrate-binding protein DctP [Humibacillus xanthopallidus]TQM65066.1 TRAP-type C4-dicarboxylate transport system substrate-binding protein [Humibacillus xanthopallidus]
MPRTTPVALMVMAVIIGLSACSSSADKAGGRGLQEVIVLEIAQLDDVAPPQVQAYAAEVEKQSRGSLRFHFNDSWRMGEIDFEKNTLEDVTGGRTAGAWVGVRSFDLIGVTSFQPLVAPMLVDSQLVQSRIFSEGIPLEMARGLEGHGLVAVAVLPGPMRKVLGVRKPFREPADFRGTVLGIQGGDIPEATAKALGATFTRMSSGARLDGVDAYEQPAENILGGFYGLEAKYITANVNLWPQAIAVVLNQASYRALTDAQREVLRKAATDAIPVALAATRAEDETAIAKLCGQQVAFPPSSDLQLAALRRAVQPVHDAIADNPDDGRMLDRLTELRAAAAAPPDVSVCPSRKPGAGSGSLPEGTYDMALENDVMSQCTDGTMQGTPGRESWFSLEVRDGKVTRSQRIDSQAAPVDVGYDGVYSTLRDRVQIDNLNARWSFDGTALQLSDMNGGSCREIVIWTTNPWVLRSDPAQPGASVVPDGRYEAVLSPADRRLCDGLPDTAGRRGLNPPSGPSGNQTWYTSITLESGVVRAYAREGSLAATAKMWWVGSYRVYGSTFELTHLTSVDHYPTIRRTEMTATFTFDRSTLTLTPVGSWPCDARVVMSRHPWALTKKAQ